LDVEELQTLLVNRLSNLIDALMATNGPAFCFESSVGDCRRIHLKQSRPALYCAHYLAFAQVHLIFANYYTSNLLQYLTLADYINRWETNQFS
jgi:hypothetical protein